MSTVARCSRALALFHHVRSRTQIGHRAFSASARTQDDPAAAILNPSEETQNIHSMDRLLTVVRKKANPAYNSAMPMRSPTLWADLLNTPVSTSTSSETVHRQDPAPLTPRHMYDSYCEIVLPFASSSELLEKYTNASGGIRTGKLMEHLDSLAGSISYKHMLGPGVDSLSKDSGFYLVTASVDRLDMLSPLHPVRDLRLSGQVIYTGRSSMEVAVKMEATDAEGAAETLLLGRFSMVCRDAATHRARAVHPLVISTPQEKALYTMGEEMKNRRQKQAMRSLDKVPPSSTEAAALHSFHLQQGQEDVPTPNRVWMGESRLEKCMLMFPQERNVHQKVFGGYLMRLAYELGFANAVMFGRQPVQFLSLDGISFSQPVPIGSILRLTSHILHTESTDRYPALIHVGVQANVVDPATGLEQTTNDFRFTWCRESGEPLERKVVPKTYKEAMMWLEGKRALEVGDEIRGLRDQQ